MRRVNWRFRSVVSTTCRKRRLARLLPGTCAVGADPHCVDDRNPTSRPAARACNWSRQRKGADRTMHIHAVLTRSALRPVEWPFACSKSIRRAGQAQGAGGTPAVVGAAEKLRLIFGFRGRNKRSCERCTVAARGISSSRIRQRAATRQYREVLREIKPDPELSGIPVVIITVVRGYITKLVEIRLFIEPGNRLTSG
jgi:hypothetical protein